MTSEEVFVPTETASEVADRESENITKNEAGEPDATKTENNVSNSETKETESKDTKEEKADEIEEGFETPEEGEGGADDDKLDDDQDIENPAYIPKTGKYYMHDSREDNNMPHEEKKSRADGKWSRDRFDERYQQPRSRKQLVEKYGFDIRLGETKEVVMEKEKEMREAGISLDDEENEKEDNMDNMRRRGEGRMKRGPGTGGARGRGHRYNNNNFNQKRPPGREDIGEKYEDTEGRNDEDEIRPAARRDMRRGDGGVRGSREGEGRGDRKWQGRGDGRMERGGRDGRDQAPRQFNRTFNNSNRSNAKEEDKGAPKRYSTQRGESYGKQTAGPTSQPSDIVYFDPTKQTRDVNPVTREKKPLDIVPPPT